MRTIALLFPLIAIAIMKENISCGCLNGGACLQGDVTGCRCLEGFLGSDCHLSASKLSEEAISERLERKYKYFYFEPSEVNYYRLTLTVCMKANPSKRGTLFYIETERSDGALRETPSIFETSQIILKDQECRKFSTHYISVKQREDESLRRIVMGLKVTQDGDQAFSLNNYLQNNQRQFNQSQTLENGLGSKYEGELFQQITIKATAQIYLQTNKLGSFLFIFTAFLLLVLVTTFITYLRRRFVLDSIEVQLDALHLQTRQLARIRRQLRALNPQETRPRTKNSLHNLEIFMPVTHYGTPQSIFIPHLLSNRQLAQSLPTSSDYQQQAETCSICLVEFSMGDEIRTTPCSHQYHRQCIDNWCESRLSCPICRRDLDFSREVRKLYYDLLRNELAM